MHDGRLAGADFMRALGCLIVLIHHLIQHFPHFRMGPSYEWLLPFEYIGGFGVVIFFVLSGFLLARPFWLALDEGQPLPSMRTYLLRRVARIGPGFWLVLTLGFVASLVLLDAPLDFGNLIRYLAGLTFVADLHPFTLAPIEMNGPLWSIGFEVSSYLLMPIGFLLLFYTPVQQWSPLAKRAAWLGVIALTLSLHIAYLSTIGLGREVTLEELVAAAPLFHTLLGEFWHPQYNPIGFFATFAIGCFAAGVQVLTASRKSPWFDLGFVAALGWLFFRLSTWTGSTFDGVLHLPYKMYPELPLLTGAVLVLGPSTVFAARLLEPRFVRYLATISFGIYIWHFFFIDLTRIFIFPDYARYPVANRIDDPLILWSATAIVVLATFVVAAASWRWIEKPAIRWARQFENDRGRGKAPSPQSHPRPG